MLLIDAPSPPALYPKQFAVFFDPARFVLCEASTKSGKTLGGLVWIYVGAVNRPGNWWWTEPTNDMAYELGYSRLRKMLERTDPRQRVWRAREADQIIELANGARIHFKSAEEPDTLYGDDVMGAVMDEATRCKEAAWFAIRTTLTATQGPARIVGNMRGRRTWVHKLGMRAKAGLPGYRYFTLTANDAIEGGVFPREELEQAERDLPKHVVDELYRAIPTDDGANPFGNDAIDRQTMEKLSFATPVAWGVDLAKKRDYVVACGLDERGATARLERWRCDWGQTEDRLVEIIGETPALVDSTGVGDVLTEYLQRRCPNIEGFIFTPRSKQQLFEGLCVTLRRGGCWHPEGILADELHSFEFQLTRTGVWYGATEGMTDDCVCAYGLANAKLRQLDGGSFGFRMI